jgi:Cytochrome P450
MMTITLPTSFDAAFEKLPIFSTTKTTTTTMIVGFILPVIMMMMYIIYNITSRPKQSSSSSSSTSSRYGCTPVLYNTVQGRSYPLLGHAITFLLYPPWDLLTLWHQKKYYPFTKSSPETSSPPLQEPPPQQQEPIVCFPLMGHTMFSIASPIYCKYILQSKIGHVQKDIYNTMKPFLSILGTGIVSSEGKHWLQQRLKMSHPLRHDILHIIPVQTLYAVQRLFTILDTPATTAATNDDDATNTITTTTTSVPIGSLLRHLTLQVISSSFLSLSHNESDETFAKLYLPIVDECNQRVWHPYRAYLFILPSFWIYLYNVYRLNAYVASLIRKRWMLRCRERSAAFDSTTAASTNTNGTSTTTTTTTHRRIDILDKILQVYESSRSETTDDTIQNDATETVVTNHPSTMLPESIVKQVRDEMKTFMLAGHETSAALMTWTMYELLLSQTTTRTTKNDNSSIDSQTLLEKVILEANQVFDPNIDWKVATEENIPIPIPDYHPHPHLNHHRYNICH